ncbi:MAG: type VI secretion system tube protein Hcp [Solirubrobacteraceae bacterium]
MKNTPRWQRPDLHASATRRTPRRRIGQRLPSLIAAIVTSVVVATIAAGGTNNQTTAAISPPTPTGQVAGQLAIDGKTMPILGFSVGATNPTTLGSGGGTSVGKASFSSLNLIKAVDANSPALFTALARGQRFPQAVFTAQWGTGSTSATMTYKLEEAVVDAVSDSGGGGTPTEALSLAFAKITWTYTDASATTTGSWNLTAGTP